MGYSMRSLLTLLKYFNFLEVFKLKFNFCQLMLEQMVWPKM